MAWDPNKSPIVADYTRSTWSLALEALEHVKTLDVGYDMLLSLEIDSSHLEMQQVRRDRLSRHTGLTPQIGMRSSPHAPRNSYRVFSYDLGANRIRIGPGGELTVNVESYSDDDTDTTEMESSRKDILDRIRAIMDGRTEKYEPRPLIGTNPEWTSSRHVGFVSGNVSVNDIIIVQSDLDKQTPFLLIVREGEGDYYDIIGQGVFFPGDYELLYFSSDFELASTAEDAILLFGCDLLPMTENSGRYSSDYDVEARAERLFVNPASIPKGAVRFKHYGKPLTHAQVDKRLRGESTGSDLDLSDSDSSE